MIQVKTIALFENLSQYDFEGQYYDLHNNFCCVRILLNGDDALVIVFESVIDKSLVMLRFQDVVLKKFEYFNSKEVENLTIDNLYRGRVEIDGKLKEFSDDGKGYFYLEFDEGQKVEFWSKGLTVKDI